MSDSVLAKFTRPHSGGDPDPLSFTRRAEEAGEGTADDHGAFGWLRGQRERAVCVELRKKNGNIVALNYGWIDRFELDLSEGITLHAHGEKYRIKGRNLNAGGSARLFQGLIRHRVPWVQEADRPAGMGADEKATVIEAISWP